MRRSDYTVRLQAMTLLGLLDEREVRLLLAWRTGDAAVISELLTECLMAAAAKEGAGASVGKAARG